MPYFAFGALVPVNNIAIIGLQKHLRIVYNLSK